MSTASLCFKVILQAEGGQEAYGSKEEPAPQLRRMTLKALHWDSKGKGAFLISFDANFNPWVRLPLVVDASLQQSRNSHDPGACRHLGHIHGAQERSIFKAPIPER